jgi:hypothetical protein
MINNLGQLMASAGNKAQDIAVEGNIDLITCQILFSLLAIKEGMASGGYTFETMPIPVPIEQLIGDFFDNVFLIPNLNTLDAFQTEMLAQYASPKNPHICRPDQPTNPKIIHIGNRKWLRKHSGQVVWEIVTRVFHLYMADKPLDEDGLEREPVLDLGVFQAQVRTAWLSFKDFSRVEIVSGNSTLNTNVLNDSTQHALAIGSSKMTFGGTSASNGTSPETRLAVDRCLRRSDNAATCSYEHAKSIANHDDIDIVTAQILLAFQQVQTFALDSRKHATEDPVSMRKGLSDIEIDTLLRAYFLTLLEDGSFEALRYELYSNLVVRTPRSPTEDLNQDILDLTPIRIWCRVSAIRDRNHAVWVSLDVSSMGLDSFRGKVQTMRNHYRLRITLMRGSLPRWSTAMPSGEANITTMEKPHSAGRLLSVSSIAAPMSQHYSCRDRRLRISRRIIGKVESLGPSLVVAKASIGHSSP